MTNDLRKHLASIAAKGGAAGTGEAKARGNSAYYKRLSAKATKARAAKQKLKRGEVK